MKKVPVIGLLTDFGTSDPYVAAMKGTILSIAPHTNIVDISHNVPPQNINEAAYILWSAFRYFPKNSIFIIVVDPEVGTKRNILCMKGDGYTFIAPDNGILKYIIGSFRHPTIVNVINRKYFLNNISNTFHGRDIFAPVAAHIANGLSLEKLGPKVTPKYGAEYFIELSKHKKYIGKIIHIDRFGNLITNILIKRKNISNAYLKLGKHTISKIFNNYASSSLIEPFMIIGNSSLLEISIKNRNAAKILNVKVNSKFELIIK